jgi:hypothetical protein
MPARWPFMFLVTESLTPRSQTTPEIRYQPSVLSLRSTASTVAPEEQPAPPSAVAARSHSLRRAVWVVCGLVSVTAAVGLARFAGSGHVTSEVRSGSPGFRSTPSGKQIHWAKKAVTVYIDDSLKQLGPGADEAVMQAFGQWVGSDPKLPDLSFDTGKTSAEPKQDGMSTVSFAKIKVPGHEHDVAITVTYSNDKTGEILEADVVLNALYPMGALTAKARGQDHEGDKDEGDDKRNHGSSSSRREDESVDCSNRYDAQNVVTHEAGHFFGLGEDMTERTATMFLSIDQCETHKRVLSASDTTAITTLYAANEDPEEAKAGPRACSFGVAPAAGSAWISGLLAGLVLLRRRRSR